MVGREGPGGPRRRQGRRAGEGARLACEHLEVVVQDERLVPSVHEALVGGDDDPGVGDHDLFGSEGHGQALPDERHRHRVAALAHADPALRVHPGREVPGGVEGLGRKRPEHRRLGHELAGDRRPVAFDHPQEVLVVEAPDRLVEHLHARGLRHRHEMVAPEPADVVLHAPLLVRALLAGLAVEGVEAVVAAEGDEALGLDPVPAEQDPGHGRLQVVGLDAGRHPLHPREGVDVPGQERLLGLGGERPVEGPARVAQPQREQPQLDHDAGDLGPELAEVDLGLDAGEVGLGHHRLGRRGDLCPDAPDVLAHGRLGDVRTVLGNEPGEDAPGGVALLLRHLEVVGEPLAHDLLVGTEDTVGALDRPAWRRDSRRQRLADDTAVDAMAPGERPDRQARTTDMARLLEVYPGPGGKGLKMRYRRYYTSRNTDGSRSVVSVGPGAVGILWIGKVFVTLMILGLPLSLTEVIPGIWGKIVAYPLEAIWLLAAFAAWQDERQRRRTKKPRPT